MGFSLVEPTKESRRGSCWMEMVMRKTEKRREAESYGQREVDFPILTVGTAGGRREGNA